VAQTSDLFSDVPSDIRATRMPLSNGAGQMSALGFGTLIPDAALTKTATRDAFDAGFRHFDCAERYRNEREVGEALEAGLAANGIARENIFVTTKLWNSNHRPERVEPAFAASLDRLRLEYLDLYLIHTPYAFQPGDEQDPRDQNGNVIYDSGVTLLDTWRALENLVDHGRCRRRTLRHRPERIVAHLRVGKNQASRGPSRIASLSA
jgi:alcohol dehydrogenase (NADP+)